MLNLTTAFNGKIFTLILIAVEVLLVICSPVVAQLAPASDPSSEQFSPSRGMKPAGSYALGDIESINMVNGNLALGLSLGALPQGRGGLSASMNLFYNSKIWDIRSVTAVAARSDGTPESRRYNLIQSLDGNWKYGFHYELRVVDREYPILTEYNQNYVPCNNFNAIYYFKVFMIFPDGSQHEFRLRDQNDWEGYFAYRPDGSTTNHCTTIQPLTGTMVYYSMDGTYMRLEVQHDSDSTTLNNPWTLYMPDGSRVTGGNAPQRVYDRNGNYLEIQEHITYNTHDAAKIEDQLGRRIVLEYGSAPNEDAVHSWSVNGTETITRIKWKTISVLRSYNNGQDTVQLLARFRDVVDQVILPSQSGGLAYTFGYNAPTYDFSAPNNNPPLGWGELNSVTLPSGAQAGYSYKLDGLNTTDPETVLTNSINAKHLTYQQEYDGASTPVTDSWSYIFDPDSDVMQMSAPDGGITKVFHYGGSGVLGVWFGNLVYKTERPDGSVVEHLWNRNTPFGHPSTFYADNPYVKTEFTSIPNASGTLVLTAVKDYTYDKNGNVTKFDEYDWLPYANVPRIDGKPSGLPQGILPTRTTTFTFFGATPDAANVSTNDPDSYHVITAPHLLKAMVATEVADSSGTAARSEVSYDDPLTTGNITLSRQWDSTKGALDPQTHQLTTINSISESTEYNQFGSPTKITDAGGFQTQLTYEAVGGFTDLYPTKIITAFGTTVARTETREYDFNTGLMTRIRDLDNAVSTATTYDIFGRPTLVKRAVGTSDEEQTSIQYLDSQRRVIVRQDLIATGDQKLVAVRHFDQLGRIRLSRQLEDSSESVDVETSGIKVQTRYLYGLGNSFTLVSNAYRAANSTLAASEATMGWTRTKADNVGRTIEVQSFSGSTLPAPWGQSSSTTGSITTAYDALFTTVTDQSGKVRRSKVDALGRLVRVDEPSDAANTLGSQTSPTQGTNYGYDVLGNLTSVTQGNQPRSFTYSSLSRLLHSSNPEAGVIDYEYDANGNLTRKIDPRLVPNTSIRRAITYDYDALNRLTTRTYNDGTPNVSYSYDAANVAFSKGRLTAVSSTVSAYSYGEYDALGRVKSGTQTTDGQAYGMSYACNKAGSIISQTYPSGRVVATNYDGAGRIAGVKNNATGLYYAGADSTDVSNRLRYAATGAIQTMKLGNGLWEHTNLNSRSQITQIGLGTSATDSSKLQIDYAYGVSANSGNLQTQTITLPGLVLIQSYTYDELNRLKSAQEVNGATQVWKQTFSYDRFGNRRFDAVNTTSPQITPANEASTNPTISTADNRISAPGHRYDLAGNLECDPTHPCGSIAPFPGYYDYDSENRIKTANGGSSSGGASYFYDGDGRRVKKIVGGPTTITTVFVYDVAGKLIAEYSDQQQSTSGTTYLTSDHLGTPRVTSRADQSISGRHDYQPFGEEIGSAVGGRQSIPGYSGNDGLRQKFTQYERDNETGLDFAQARYYANAQGRFTSADPYVIFFDMKRGRNARERMRLLLGYISQPQNWNRYTYSLNDPVNLIDPTGLMWLTKDHENYQWVDDDKYKAEDWEGYEEVEAGTIAYFGAGWGSYQDKYNGLLGSYVKLNADGTLSSAGISPADEVDDPASASGALDINISYGSPYFIGLTGGAMWDRNGGPYPYIGAGFMAPGPSGSATFSPDNVSGGFNAELQGGYGLYGSVGIDEAGNSFTAFGSGYGASATGYYVFGAAHPPPGPHRPMNNDSRNSNSNRRERPGKSNCACNSN